MSDEHQLHCGDEPMHLAQVFDERHTKFDDDDDDCDVNVVKNGIEFWILLFDIEDVSNVWFVSNVWLVVSKVKAVDVSVKFWVAEDDSIEVNEYNESTNESVEEIEAIESDVKSDVSDEVVFVISKDDSNEFAVCDVSDEFIWSVK